MPSVPYTKSAVDAKDAAVKASADAHAARTDNPHAVTADQVGAYTTAETDNLLDAKADQTAVDSLTTVVATKAPLASPALTGTPTAPTPAAGVNTTQLATCAFVATAIAALNLGTAATHAATDFDAAGAAAAAQSAAQAASLAKASNLSDLANAATARTNLGLGSMALQPSSNVTVTGGTITALSLTAPTIKASNGGLSITTTNTRTDTDGPDVTIQAAGGTDGTGTAVTTGASLTLTGGGADGGGAADATITPGTGGKFVVAGSATVTGTLTADGSSLTNLPAANLTGTIARDRLPTILHPGAVPQGRQWGPPYASYSTSNRSVVSNTIYFVPLYFPPGTPADTLGTSVRVAAASGGKLRLGLYASVNGLPSTLVVDGGETASDGASPPYDAEVTLAGGAQTLTGWYWLAISVSGGCSLGCTAAGTGSWVMGSQPGGNANASVSYASTYGPLPSSIVQASLSFATTVLPWGYARKA